MKQAGMTVAAIAGLCSLVLGANVALDTNTHFQTIRAYGVWQRQPPNVTQELIDEAIHELVNEFGINRVRFEPPGENRIDNRRWEWFNDDGDPEHINWAAFDTDRFDKTVTRLVMPYKNCVEAGGGQFEVYVSPSFFDTWSSGPAPAWLRYSAGEYTEYAMSLLLRLRDVHGITADFYCIMNEAGNVNPYSATAIQPLIKTLGPRMKAAGLPTRIQYPETVSIDDGWNDYVNNPAVRDDTQMWSHIGLVSWHLYGGASTRRNMRDAAVSRGLQTAQTEFMALTTSILYDDMTIGDVSVWEIYQMYSQLDMTGADYNRLVRKGWYWPFRQVLHYARPGSVRVAASSDDSQLRVLAFVRNGMTIVVLLNDLDSTARTASLSGLVPGIYGLCQSVNRGAYAELGLQTVPGTGLLAVNVPGNTVLTLYPHPGSNLPPVAVDWKAAHRYLALPSSSTTLSAAARDPELDPITYQWSVKRTPPGAPASLATPNAASCVAEGLTVTGSYAFNVAISDPTHTINREARIDVFGGNRAPFIVDLHSRNPIFPTLPQTTTELRVYAWDMEGGPLSYHWSLTSQPPGAAAVLLSPASNACLVAGMTAPGDYVFQVGALDGASTSTAYLTVPCYPASQAPVISNAEAMPATIMLPASTAMLSAVTADADGDVLSHWWSVKNMPDGADIVFSRPGSNCTMVSGLAIPGAYTFTLTVVDRNAFATRDVTVVADDGSIETNFVLMAPGDDRNWSDTNIWLHGVFPRDAGDIVVISNGTIGGPGPFRAITVDADVTVGAVRVTGTTSSGLHVALAGAARKMYLGGNSGVATIDGMAYSPNALVQLDIANRLVLLSDLRVTIVSQSNLRISAELEGASNVHLSSGAGAIRPRLCSGPSPNFTGTIYVPRRGWLGENHGSMCVNADVIVGPHGNVELGVATNVGRRLVLHTGTFVGTATGTAPRIATPIIVNGHVTNNATDVGPRVMTWAGDVSGTGAIVRGIGNGYDRTNRYLGSISPGFDGAGQLVFRKQTMAGGTAGGTMLLGEAGDPLLLNIEDGDRIRVENFPAPLGLTTLDVMFLTPGAPGTTSWFLYSESGFAGAFNSVNFNVFTGHLASNDPAHVNWIGAAVMPEPAAVFCAGVAAFALARSVLPGIRRGSRYRAPRHRARRSRCRGHGCILRALLL